MAAGPVVSAELKATASYGVTLGGTHIATVEIRLSDTGQRYAMALDARVSGLAQIVASGTARVESAGLSTGSGLVSEKFDLVTRAQGGDFRVDVAYEGRDVTAFIVDPPIVNHLDRVALERRHLTGVNDMMAAFVLRGQGLDHRLCNRSMQIFTGMERFNLAMRFTRADEATSRRTGYQGPLVLCSVQYTPVSGHYTNSDLTTYLAESDKILLWFAPLNATGYFIPYRALIATSVGDLSIVLTDLQQN